MKKIPTLFVRDWDGDRRYVLPEVTPGCEWVAKGEGAPTRKYDGTCVMFDGERWWARREVKERHGTKTYPPLWQLVEHDDETGKDVGWEPVEQSGFARWHAEALRDEDGETFTTWPAGTYELVGPKVNGDPEGYGFHTLVLHAYAEKLDGYTEVPRDFDGLAAWLYVHPYEGIVWHHPDGRMAKIKRRDFRYPGNGDADV